MGKVDLVLVNPSDRAEVYQALGVSLTAIEPPNRLVTALIFNMLFPVLLYLSSTRYAYSPGCCSFENYQPAALF